MSTLDIRTQSDEPVDTIIVGDSDINCISTVNIIKERNKYITFTCNERTIALSILTEQHARDIIKGIEKAIELGWFKECK